jgi:predicted phosphodiesterase
MKFALASDIHLEFGKISLENTENADLLILSGDIAVACRLDGVDDISENKLSSNFHNFFQECCDRFPNVIYVMGNHEHYDGDFAHTLSHLREKLGYLKNLHILEKEFIELNGIVFFGGTLWTDMNKEDPHTLYSISGYMNDFRVIKNSYRKNNLYATSPRLNPEDVVVEHKSMLQHLSDAIESRPNDTFVVVGHHSPSKLSTKPKYKKDVVVNGAYSSDLSEFILNRPQIKYWTHGHTHHEFDYMIGDTRIICNPRGYINYEPEASDFELKYFEI